MTVWLDEDMWRLDEIGKSIDLSVKYRHDLNDMAFSIHRLPCSLCIDARLPRLSIFRESVFREQELAPLPLPVDPG